MSTGEDRYGPRDPEGDIQPAREPGSTPDPSGTDPSGTGPSGTADAAAPEEAAQQERKPWNGAGWIGLGAAALAFVTNLGAGWSGAMMVAAFGVAFCLTALVRVYRGRATNRNAALIGIALAVGTFVLQGIWSSQAQECKPLIGDKKAWSACYDEHAGIF